MYFIKSASTISHQPSFRNNGFSENISLLKSPSELISPDYKNFINPTLLRRMGKILRMSVACSVDSLEQAGIENPDAIIVGTGLGCLEDTEKFLNNIITIKGAMLPPTSFIQSTHNTIAGQISLLLQNHNYNMTHTQNTLSFEHSLLDAILCLGEGKENILVGAADEFIEPLNDIAEKLNYKNIQLTSGASFFVLSNEKSKIGIRNVSVNGLINSFPECIKDFFSESKLKMEEIDLVLFSTNEVSIKKELEKLFQGKIILDYEKYCGTYFTNSAFALHLANDILENKTEIKKVLICNNLNRQNLGLIIVERNET